MIGLVRCHVGVLPLGNPGNEEPDIKSASLVLRGHPMIGEHDVTCIDKLDAGFLARLANRACEKCTELTFRRAGAHRIRPRELLIKSLGDCIREIGLIERTTRIHRHTGGKLHRERPAHQKGLDASITITNEDESRRRTGNRRNPLLRSRCEQEGTLAND